MFKHLVLAAVLCAPCLAFAGQAMSVDECSTVANNAAVRAVDTVISPMHDGGGGTPALHAPGTGRGADETDSRTTQADNSAPLAASSAHGSGDTNIRSHKGGGHGRAPWQSLLPGVMK